MNGYNEQSFGLKKHTLQHACNEVTVIADLWLHRTSIDFKIKRV